jgi:hypothetical protein
MLPELMGMTPELICMLPELMGIIPEMLRKGMIPELTSMTP